MSSWTADLLESLTQQVRRRHGVPGLLVGTSSPAGEHVLASGSANTRTGAAMRKDTRVCIGSVTKLLTATAVAALDADGVLDLHCPVSSLVPEAASLTHPGGTPVRVRDLLTHRAGWYGDVMSDHGRGADAITRYVQRLSTDAHWQFPPGTVAAYNNAAFVVAGRVIEAVTGHTYEEALEALVLAPAGMDTASFWPEHVMAFPHAVGHTALEHSTDVAAEADDYGRGGPGLGGGQEQGWRAEAATTVGCPRSLNPAGGLMATAHDMLSFSRAVLAGVDGEGPFPFAAGMVAAQADGLTFASRVGLGWLHREVAGVPVLFHGGRVSDQVSLLVIDPQSRSSAFLAANANTGHLLLEDAATLLFEHAAGAPESPPSTRPMSEPTEKGSGAPVAVAPELPRSDGQGSAVAVTPAPAAALVTGLYRAPGVLVRVSEATGESTKPGAPPVLLISMHDEDVSTVLGSAETPPEPQRPPSPVVGPHHDAGAPDGDGDVGPGDATAATSWTAPAPAAGDGAVAVLESVTGEPGWWRCTEGYFTGRSAAFLTAGGDVATSGAATVSHVSWLGRVYRRQQTAP